jgi:hypothetical protein
MNQPGVMDLNMRSASFGMKVLRHLLPPFLLTPLPVMILENMVTYAIKAIQEPRALNPGCPICQANRRVGYGDCAPPLGLEKSSARHHRRPARVSEHWAGAGGNCERSESTARKGRSQLSFNSIC